MPKPTDSKLKHRAKALPWAVFLQGGAILGRRWAALSAKEREGLVRLMRESRGRVSNLSEKERRELRRLAGKLDLKGIGGDLLALRGRRRRKRR
ncbi:MAG TPA: hypothetical protein VES97_02245 [Solirubrobacteraceae bacterium]|nr:hypothetical protein [Solirubrobacteraceae bacterium]